MSAIGGKRAFGSSPDQYPSLPPGSAQRDEVGLKPARHELWFGNRRYPAEQSQQYGRGARDVVKWNEIRHGHNRLRPAGRAFARYARKGPIPSRSRYGRRREIASMFCRLTDTGDGVRACLTDSPSQLLPPCALAVPHSPLTAQGGPFSLRVLPSPHRAGDDRCWIVS